MEGTESITVGGTVALDYRTASVFQKYGIDFCCRGGQTIDEACNKKAIDKTILLDEIDKVVNANNDPAEDYNAWPLDKLASYIEEKHHHYVAEQTPVLLQFLDKLCKVHGGRHPELFEINKEFNHVAEELAMHMHKEEMVLFPYIKKIARAETNKENYAQPGFGAIQNPINMMMGEHTVEGDRIARIASLSDSYTTPADGCTTYRVAFNMLKDFEADLHKHIHLENNILFPKSIELERSLQ